MGEMVSFASNGGTAEGYLARPASGGGPGVVVIQEWWGLNDNIKGIADRFAAEGFVALAPDLYHGQVTAEPDEAGKLMMGLRIEEAEKDLRGSVNYLAQLPAATDHGALRRESLALVHGDPCPDLQPPQALRDRAVRRRKAGAGVGHEHDCVRFDDRLLGLARHLHEDAFLRIRL